MADDLAPDGVDSRQERVEAAWRDFVVDMRHEYPADEWSADALRAERNELLLRADLQTAHALDAERRGLAGLASTRNERAAEYSRQADGVAALLMDEGDLVMGGDASTRLEFMERVVSRESALQEAKPKDEETAPSQRNLESEMDAFVDLISASRARDEEFRSQLLSDFSKVSDMVQARDEAQLAEYQANMDFMEKVHLRPYAHFILEDGQNAEPEPEVSKGFEPGT